MDWVDSVDNGRLLLRAGLVRSVARGLCVRLQMRQIGMTELHAD